MLVVVTYDVNTETREGRSRLRRVAKACVGKGQRVQNSVFECLVDNAGYLELKHDLGKIIDPSKDSLRFYRLGNSYSNCIEKLGRDDTYEPEGVLIL